MTAALKIRDGTNTLRTITVLKVRDASNTLRTITEIWVRDTNNVPRPVFNPSGSATLACALDTTAVSGFSAGTGTATTPSPLESSSALPKASSRSAGIAPDVVTPGVEIKPAGMSSMPSR